ncbi:MULTISPECIES: hypothetical protein [Pseudomonas]|uniref:hypothetical protein n=1 Tax=Pseudomonas TaxID=286 RepID=UPI003D080761
MQRLLSPDFNHRNPIGAFMPVLFRSLAAGAALVLASVTAFAAGDHDHAHDHRPLHGGVVTEVRDVDYELVVQAAVAQLYLRDHGEQVNVSNSTAKLTLLTGSQKQEVQLTPAADGSRLEGSGTFGATKDTKAVVQVEREGNVTGVRFVLP